MLFFQIIIHPQVRIPEMAASFFLRIILIIIADTVGVLHVMGRSWREEPGSKYDRNTCVHVWSPQIMSEILYI